MPEYNLKRLQPHLEELIDRYPEAEHFEQLTALADDQELRFTTVRRAYEVVLFLRSIRGRENDGEKPSS